MNGLFVRRIASVAQLVEHRFRKPEVKGSSPFAGSTHSHLHVHGLCLLISGSQVRALHGSFWILAFRATKPVAFSVVYRFIYSSIGHLQTRTNKLARADGDFRGSKRRSLSGCKTSLSGRLKREEGIALLAESPLDESKLSG